MHKYTAHLLRTLILFSNTVNSFLHGRSLRSPPPFPGSFYGSSPSNFTLQHPSSLSAVGGCVLHPDFSYLILHAVPSLVESSVRLR